MNGETEEGNQNLAGYGLAALIPGMQRKAEARRRMEARNAVVAVELTKIGAATQLHPSEPKSP